MSIEEDRLVLNEYDAWQVVNVSKDVDLSVEAFLTEREHEHNAMRIAHALLIIDSARFTYNYEQEMDNAAGHRAMQCLSEVDAILTGGRPYIMNTTLTGPPERIFT